MQPIQTQKINQQPKYPLGKKPDLTEKEMKNMRMILQSVAFPELKITYFYNIVQKESNMGFSSNERLIFLNVEAKAVSYLSKVPQGYLPYTNYEEIASNKVKQKVIMTEAQSFKCTPLKGKISTLVMEWIDKEKKEKNWTFTCGSSKLMNDWMGLINSVKDGTFDKEKYDQMKMINQASPLTSNQPLTPQKSNNPVDQTLNPQNNQQNIPSSLLKQGSQQPNQVNPLIKPPLGSNTPTNNQPLPQNKIKPTTPSNQLGPNIPSSGNNNPNPISSTFPPSNNYLPASNVINPPPLNSLNQPTTPKNVPTFPSDQYQNQPYLTYNNQIPRNQQIIKPQPVIMQGGQLQLSRKPKIQRMGESAITPINPPPQTFTNYNTSTPINNNNHLSSQPSNTGLSAKQENFIPVSKNYQIVPSQQSRQLTNNPSEPPGDFVEELKKQRLKNPGMFVLNNQLSKKNIHEFNSPQYQELDHPGYYNTNQSYPKQGGSSNNQPIEPISRIPSQNQMNRKPSQLKEISPNEQQSFYGSKQPQNRPISRQNTNQQPLIRDPSTRQYNREPSRSQMSRNIEIYDKNSVKNNENEYGNENGNGNEQDDYQGYKPTTNWPQSTKNLNKIRSDYLERKASNIANFSNPPNTTKNQNNRLMENNYIKQPSDHNSKKHTQQPKKLTNPSFERLPKFDSSQSRRQDSMNNLNKVTTSYMQSKNQNYPSYNDMWLETSNPNKKLEVHDQFMTRSRQLVCQIVDELSFPKSQRQFQPIDSDDKENLYTFLVENIIVKLHFFNQQESINDSDDNINQDAPVLYDNTTYDEIKRQFYNYNLVLGVTSNEGKIKVPLCSYIEYRGVLAVVKADIPATYKEVEPYTYSDQFEALENMIKVRFMFNTFNCYESQGYRGGEGRFIVLWNLKNLIPGIPNNLKNSTSYFRKQLLLQYDQILQDLQSSSQAHAFTLRHALPQFLSKLQSLEIHIVSSRDLVRQFHRAGLSLSYLPELYKQTNSVYLKRLFMSEMVSGIFTEVVRSELNHAFSILPAENMQNSSPQEINHVVVSCAHVLINQFFSYTQRSQSIWKLIVNEASKRFRMIVSKEDVVGGYLLSAIVEKLSLECDFKQKSFLKQKKFFVHQNIIPREVFITFIPRVRQYDMETICPTYSKCKEILQSQQLTIQSYEHLSMILNLRTRTTELPEYYRPLKEEFKTYISNYIPYTLQNEYEHLDVYEFMYEEPITYNGIKTAFLAIKWLIKANQVQKANQLFEIKFHQLSYWLSEYNTVITQFYDFFSMYYASIGDFEQSICLAKSSLINMTKVLGPGALPVADKHYQLGNIYFKINKKNEALKQYNKTKQILINHEKTTIPEYGIILLKIALLCLNFGQLTDCLTNAIQAERIFQNNGGNDHEEIQCFQILSRVYQITRKQQDIASLCEACCKTFNMTQNPKILQRMLKIILFPKLTQLSSQQQKSLLPLLTKLQQHISSNDQSIYLDSFNFLHKLALKGLNIKRKMYYYLQNVVILAEQVNRKDLMRKHTSFSEKTNGQAQDMLVIIEAVGNMIGWSFLTGALKEGWYD